MKTIQNLTILAGVTFLFVGCGLNKTKETVAEEVRVVQVKTQVLKKQTISRVIDLSTTLQGYETMNVAPSMSGKIEHIYVEIGSKVSKGQMLVRMDQNQYNTTKLAYANLGIEMARMEALKESGSISQQTYDRTKLSYEQTKVNLDFLERNTFVKAQFDGVISAKNYEDGELYGGLPILVLTQITTLKALVSIPETYFPNVKSGMSVKLYSDIYPDNVFPASVEIIYPTIDPSTHTFQVKLRIPNSRRLLRPGMYVRTNMELGETTALMVPYQAVLKLVGANDRYVFVNQEGVAKRVSVVMGQRFDELVEVISDDLHEGDELVVVGQAKLVDGAKLNVVK
ncbi:MAG TPA: efflux RND transporter periplasmic adaptor subunit [Paludibacteraceae bacterium]|jgi:membrane fusion protein (multidrug efflux system)|nr:MAG: Toluene efflux pump periplasmic linker protein TtgD precursor [Bacteroidetes bacterium ADurb.Bin057]HOA46813.1 efflux RND transporter periplasmic adaptor subunit [Paludibacteraceae bacterium]HOH70995.1 efflux RND transporter periplasmic adaptor subunit [Paludibacteraceae bacterium]HPH73217.1 efflux RND transporter periplasmic adaptor subunit [Paludibacteraceae bacterium]HPO48019.1 efflux RND transporter periplasmic adaptor subunit [Paludibacteraceae bacterium]